MIVRGVDGTESSNVEEIQVDEWMQTVEACAIESITLSVFVKEQICSKNAMNKVHNRTTGAMRVPLQIQTCLCPVEQRGQLPAIWKARFGVAQFVEEAMGTRFQRRDSSPRRVFEETRDERDGFYRCTWSENLSSIRMFK